MYFHWLFLFTFDALVLLEDERTFCCLLLLHCCSVWSAFFHRWEESDDTCPVSPPATRPSFHRAPIPCRGSPWKQSNDEASSKINGWRAQNMKCQSHLLCTLLMNKLCAAKFEEWVGGMTSSFVQSTYSCAQKPTHCFFLRGRYKWMVIIHVRFLGDNGNRMFHFQPTSD